jgi:molybdenum cofactor cytidylyltransferase
VNVAVLLAAGASTRFGSPKQVTPWQGVPLVRFVVNEVLSVVSRVVVVTGAHEALVRDALDGVDVELVHAEHWARGPGASIKAGLGVVPNESRVLITLCDLPQVTREDYGRLINAPGDLIASAFDHTVGAPAVFEGPFLEALRSVDDASGARHLLAAQRAHVTAVPCPAAAMDLDVPLG